MGNSQSSSGTQFTSEGLPVLQSLKPCHLSGDPDLYGLGIRVGFYLQYLAAIIAILSGVEQEFIGWRAAFVPLAAATFVGLCINSTGDTLVILDWAIMIGLVIGFPAYFALPVFKGFRTDYKHRQQLYLHQKYAKQLEPVREANFGEYRDKIAIALGAVTHAEELIMDETPRGRDEVRQLVSSVTEAALQVVRFIEARPADATDHAGRIIGQLRPAISELGRVRDDLQAVRAQVRNWQLRDHHIEALKQIGVHAQAAKDAETAIREIAKREQAVKQEIRKVGLVVKRIHDLGLVDTVSAGVSLIIYSAYCFLTPWLFFFGTDRGEKAGCDVRVLFVLAPVSVYNKHFALFLKVVAVFASVLGLAVFLFGLMFLVIGLAKPFEQIAEERRNSVAAAAAAAAAQPLQNQPGQAEIHMTTAIVHQTHRNVAVNRRQWVARHLNDVRQQYHYYINTSEEPSKAAVKKQIDFNHILWGFSLSLLLIGTIVIVEMTIQVNHLTMGPLLSSTGQLIALLVGAFMLLLILYKCLEKMCKHYDWDISLGVVPAMERWLDRMIPTRPRPRQPATQDPEMTAGLINGRPGDERTEAQAGVTQIIGERIQEIHDEPEVNNRAI